MMIFWLLLITAVSSVLCQPIKEENTTLLLVQTLSRHGDRAPSRLYSPDADTAAHWPEGLGKITLLGRKQQYAVGKFLRTMYKDFITSNPNEILVNSSSADRCLRSAEALVAAFYAPQGIWKFEEGLNWQPIPVHYLPAEQDKYLSFASPCPRSVADSKRLFNSKPVQEIFQKYKYILDFFSDHLGYNVSKGNSAFRLHDTLLIELIHNISVPQWAHSYWNELEEVADVTYRSFFSTPTILRLRTGPLLEKILENMKRKVMGLNPDLKTQVFSSVMISALKPETVIFFIDTKPSLSLFLEVLAKFDGKFLFQPEHLSFRVPVTFSEGYKEKYGCLPVVCSRGAFFVWQKLSTFEPDPKINTCPIKLPIDIKETSQNPLDKSSNENEEVLNITKTLKDLIIPKSPNTMTDSVGSVFNNSHLSALQLRADSSAMSSLVNAPKQLESNVSFGNVYSNSYISDSNKSVQSSDLCLGEAISAKPSPKQILTHKSASSQNLVTTQELPLINFDVKSYFSNSLKKSSSIDNSFFQDSPTSLTFLGESDFLHNSLHSSTIEETYPIILPPQNVTKKNISENKEKIDVPKSNQVLKPTSESKATQTELHQSATNSSLIKGLTERVQQLVSSLENEVQKNIPRSRANSYMHESSYERIDHSSCSTNCDDSDVNIQPQSGNSYQKERENPIRRCNYVHCCASRHMMHRCEMHCCQSCFHRCNINPHMPSCQSNFTSLGTSSAQPQIVIPLQNVNNDILLQLISAVKSSSKPQ